MDIVKRIASMMRPYRKTMVMVFALCACGSKTDDTKTDGTGDAGGL